MLLLEARKLHPAVKDFEAFLKKVHGLGRSRAYDLLRLAGGRTTDDELKKDARDRKRKSREKQKETQNKELPKPEPKPISVTEPHVTEIPIEDRRQAMADLATAEFTPEEKSDRALVKWKRACEDYCNEMTEADLKNARVYFMEQRWRRKQKRAA